MKAMVVDDSKAMRIVIGRILKGIGFDVSDACNGVEGIEWLSENGAIDLVLVDWNMPEMNGFDFVCTVRAKEEYKDMKLVMVTTETDISQMAKALEAGAEEYIMKPFTKESILEKLAILGINP